MREDKVVAVLYLLMRDHLPVGTVTQVVNEIRDCGEANLALTNKHLEAHAKDLLERLH